MDTIRRHFERMGAELIVESQTERFRVDVRDERFVLSVSGAVEVQVLDLEKRDRHLLLMVRDDDQAFKYLCGHDERHWFAAALPSQAGIRDVATAKEALKPRVLRVLENRAGMPRKERERRRNAVSIRQGEWFFVPAPRLQVDPLRVLRNEPLRRGNGKPHMAEECVRFGGETVYVCSRRPRGIREAEYRRLIEQRPDARKWRWSVQVREPQVYVRGRVRHPDHKTIELHGWHQVLVNTEGTAPGMERLAFID